MTELIFEDRFKLRSTRLIHVAGSLPAKHTSQEVTWLPTLLLSATTVEAFVNDLLYIGEHSWQDATKTPRLAAMTSMLRQMEDSRAQLLLKLEAIHFAMTTMKLPFGVEPYQSLQLLIAIRHRLVHPRPLAWTTTPDVERGETRELTPGDSRLLKQLLAKNLVPPIPKTTRPGGDVVDWMDALSNRRAGVWSIATALDTMDTVVSLFSEDDTFQEVWSVVLKSFRDWFAQYRPEAP